MRSKAITIPIFALLGGLFLAFPASSSDHDDTPELKSIPRHDARITDLFAFLRGDRLVLILCTDPTVPAGATEYRYAKGLSLRIAIDNDSEVRFDNAGDLHTYGGTVVRPHHISEDVVFTVSGDSKKGAELKIEGLRGNARNQVQFFAGPRDDPFIRGPRIGKNVAAVVLEMPLALVLKSQPTLLIWAMTNVPDVRGPMSDMTGRALRSQFPENMALNTLPPREHFEKWGVPPDVMIFDTSRPASFPNGRALTDDVVDLVGDPRVLANDAPYPSANDVAFLASFPYLAPPH